MSVPLDYSERVALRQKQATATVTALLETLERPAPVTKQAPPDKPSATWQRLLKEAQVKFNTGLAPSMHEALGQVAKQFPALYEAYRQEQLAACGSPVAKSQPLAPAPQTTHSAVEELETRIAKVMEKAPSLSRPEAWSRVMQSPEAQALYKSYRASRG
jgi:hypothetical protein